MVITAFRQEKLYNFKLREGVVSSSKYRGGLLHEMFHLFGIMHTQMRKDRDEHITVLRQNIQRGVGSLEYNVRIGLILICIST